MHVDDLAREVWIVGAGGEGDPQFGAWPTLTSAHVAYEARGWQTRLGLVALGCSAFIGDRNEAQMRLFAHDVTGHVFDAGHDFAEEVPDEMAEVVLPFLSKQ